MFKNIIEKIKAAARAAKNAVLGTAQWVIERLGGLAAPLASIGVCVAVGAGAVSAGAAIAVTAAVAVAGYASVAADVGADVAISSAKSDAKSTAAKFVIIGALMVPFIPGIGLGLVINGVMGLALNSIYRASIVAGYNQGTPIAATA
jgi:hypothetical protein